MVRDKKKESLMFSTLNRFCGSREVFSSNNNIKTHLNSDLLFTGFFEMDGAPLFSASNYAHNQKQIMRMFSTM